jgi:hypothetical protein
MSSLPGWVGCGSGHSTRQRSGGKGEYVVYLKVSTLSTLRKRSGRFSYKQTRIRLPEPFIFLVIADLVGIKHFLSKKLPRILSTQIHPGEVQGYLKNCDAVLLVNALRIPQCIFLKNRIPENVSEIFPNLKGIVSWVWEWTKMILAERP